MDQVHPKRPEGSPPINSMVLVRCEHQPNGSPAFNLELANTNPFQVLAASKIALEDLSRIVFKDETHPIQPTRDDLKGQPHFVVTFESPSAAPQTFVAYMLSKFEARMILEFIRVHAEMNLAGAIGQMEMAQAQRRAATGLVAAGPGMDLSKLRAGR